MSSKGSSNKKMTYNKSQKDFFNPFPGLRPFGVEESHLFFGREGQSDEILKKLSANNFVAVIGASGSGKSSLMYCGLIPILYGGFITNAGSNWRVVATRPGNGPVENLANALVKSESRETLNEETALIRKTITTAVLRSSSLGLIEAVKQLNSPGENVLVLVDQFEELFRYKRSTEDTSSTNETEAFIKLLLEAVKQKEVPIYIVLTMRSDFIGECAQFQNLTKLINESQYLIPQMTREDLREAIVGPVAVGGGQISPHLVQELLNDVGDNPDQLPILQHALMRTWNFWAEHREETEAMGIYHYDGIGTMAKALSEHANEAYDELNEEEKRVCESMFKILTEKAGDNRGIRHPTKLENISLLTGASIEEAIKVIEVFRKPGRSFLTPSPEFTITKNSIIDISHESLMRIWDRLKVWVEEEYAAVQTYLRISEAAAMYQLGKTSLWRPPDLQLALNWREKQKPTLGWAERYNPAFERAMVFLDTSDKAYETEEQNKIMLQKRALSRSRRFAIVLGTAAIISLGLFVYSFILQVEADRQRVIAEKSQKQAVLQKEEADKQKEIALAKEKEAREQKLEADRQRENALLQEQNATKSAEEALAQKSIADQKSAEAIKQTKIAEIEKGKAQKNAKEALEQKGLADKSSSEAKGLRMLSISQSMAVKSVQVNKDNDQKALLAFQAYQFNNKYGGKMHHPDIYDGLYFALKNVNITNKYYNTLKGHKSTVRAVAFTPNGKQLYSASSDGKILLWNMEGIQKKYTTFDNFDAINRTLEISSDGKWLACGSERPNIQLYDLSKKDQASHKELVGHKSIVYALAFTPDNKSLYSSSADKTILLWDVSAATNKVFAKLVSDVKCIDLDKKGETLAGGSDDGKLLIWNVKNPQSPASVLYEGSKNVIQAVAFSNNGRILAAGDDQGVVRIWDMSSKELLATLSGHNARIADLKFSPDDKMLASSSYDHNVQLWRIDNLNDQPIVLKDNGDWASSISFSPDGNYIVAGCKNGLIKLYPTKTSIMADEICNKIPRNMTKKEWSSFVASDIPYEKTCANLPKGE